MCCSNKSGRMICPTLVRVRKNSSSSSSAISGAGILPFKTPISIIGRGSTCPSRPPAGKLGQGKAAGGVWAAAAAFSARQSKLGTSPTAPLNLNVASPVVAGSPGSNVPLYTLLNLSGNCVPGRPLAMSDRPESGPKENMYVCVPSPIVAKPSPPEIC